jgi:hypothetical protein
MPRRRRNLAVANRSPDRDEESSQATVVALAVRKPGATPRSNGNDGTPTHQPSRKQHRALGLRLSQLRDTKSLGPPCLAIQWLFAVTQRDAPGTLSNAIGDETSGTRSVSPGRQEELRQLAKSKPAGNGAEWDPERDFASGRIGEIFAKPNGLCETDAETEKSLKWSRKSGEREE